jgi:ADP-heptose:LPS heptosyltransferase
MGDVIMSTPAFRALKESFGATLALLTSSMAQSIVPFIPMIEELIVADLPWVKAGMSLDAPGIQQLIQQLREKGFDAAVIFTVYSQSALPAALLTMLAGIPRRLAYCRENPYGLLTDWAPDGEPYRFIQHQVERDLKLVNSIGAYTGNDRLSLEIDPSLLASAQQKLRSAAVEYPSRYIIFHPGVSEEKRQYPLECWMELAQYMGENKIPVLVTGTDKEKALCAAIAAAGGDNMYNVAGLLSVGEFIALIDHATVIVSVNTATAHIAAARQKPVLVLYACTNPQHTPWKTESKVFPFSITGKGSGKNEIVLDVQRTLYKDPIPFPMPADIAAAIKSWWK